MSRNEIKLMQLRVEQHKNSILADFLKQQLHQLEARDSTLKKEIKDTELDIIVTEVLFAERPAQDDHATTYFAA